MHEILPGIHHWTAFRDTIRTRVSSYYVEPAGVLIDPLIPEAGLEALTALEPRPRQIVLSNRHHRRDSAAIADALDCPIRTPAPGADEFADEPRAQRYEFGDEVAPGLTAVEIGILAPDEAGLLISHGPGAIAFGDTLTRHAGAFGFVADEFLGDDPRAVKDGLRAAFRGLLARDFDALLFAHGDPVPSGGKAALRRFVEQPVGQPDYGSAG